MVRMRLSRLSSSSVDTLTPGVGRPFNRNSAANFTGRGYSSPLCCCSRGTRRRVPSGVNRLATGVSMLELQNFLVKEQVGLLKTTDTYDIYDPESGEQVGVAKEVPGSLVTILRWFISKKLMPTKAEVREHPDGSLVFTIKKPVGFFRETVEVYDAQGEKIGHFKSKILSFGG